MSKGRGILGRLGAGLGRTSARLVSGIGELFARRRLDAAAVEGLEEVLIEADLGVTTAARLVQGIARERFGKDVSADEVRRALADAIEPILAAVARPLVVDPAHRPHVILVCGVNGTGKTTTVAKLAKRLKDEGRSVMLAAADTFRAAAVEQLQVWGARAGCPVVWAAQGADAAGLVHDALARARAERFDVLLIDTAGRLHNKADLMAGLKKIVRVVAKLDEGAPHDRLLVLDATTGQNAITQVEVFREMVDVSGLVLTKLDGTAKGGVVVALAERFGLPVHAIGVGEAMDDLSPFDPRAFARALLGLTD